MTIIHSTMLAEFQPVNGTREERNRRMRERDAAHLGVGNYFDVSSVGVRA